MPLFWLLYILCAFDCPFEWLGTGIAPLLLNLENDWPPYDILLPLLLLLCGLDECDEEEDEDEEDECDRGLVEDELLDEGEADLGGGGKPNSDGENRDAARAAAAAAWCCAE